jgi:hypothetical protein
MIASICILWLFSTLTCVTCLLSSNLFTFRQGIPFPSEYNPFIYSSIEDSLFSLSATPLIDVASTELELPEDFQTECLVDDDPNCLPIGMVTLPRHSNGKVSLLLEKTEKILRFMHMSSKAVERNSIVAAKDRAHEHEVIHANNYVDLGKIDT